MKRCFVLIILHLFIRQINTAATVYSTVGTNNFNVPAGAAKMIIDMKGAKGGGSSGGGGARVQATLPVSPGTVYYYYIGGKGSNAIGGAVAGGYNGGKKAESCFIAKIDVIYSFQVVQAVVLMVLLEVEALISERQMRPEQLV
jgi:hypothetical protein